MAATATAVGEQYDTATARGYHERALQGYSVYRDLDDTLEPLLLKFFFSHISTPTLAPIYFFKNSEYYTPTNLQRPLLNSFSMSSLQQLKSAERHWCCRILSISFSFSSPDHIALMTRLTRIASYISDIGTRKSASFTSVLNT